MMWSRVEKRTWSFGPWAEKGWHLRVQFYEDVDRFLGRIWVSNFRGQPFISLRTFSSFHEFSEGLYSLQIEVLQSSHRLPDTEDLMLSFADGWLDRAYQEAALGCQL